MPAKGALDTINGTTADPLGVAVPIKIKNRTSTALSACSVSTERRSVDARDAVDDKSREVDDARDVNADDTSLNVDSRNGCDGKCAMTFPLFAASEGVVGSRRDEEVAAVNVISSKSSFQKGVAASKDITIDRSDRGDSVNINNDDGGTSCLVFDAAVQYFYSCLEIGAQKVTSSCVCPKASAEEEEMSLVNTEASPEAKDLLTATENYAADICERIEKVEKEIVPAAKSANSRDRSKLQKQDIQISKSGDSTVSVKTQITTNSAISNGSAPSIKTQGTTTKSIKTQGTATKSIETLGTINSVKSRGTGTLHAVSDLQSDNEAQAPQAPRVKSGCCFMSVFTCHDDLDADQRKKSEDNSQKLPPSPMNLDQLIGDTLNITSSKVHILDTFSDDNTYGESIEHPSHRTALDIMTPRAQNLLDEIEDIENSLFDVRQTASKEKIGEIEKRQDPFIQKMATIKQHLLDQQTLIQSAPDNAFDNSKKEYYRAISHAAMLNAEVETRRAELELKKIRLESMRVQEEMDQMMAIDDTFDDTIDGSLDQSLMTRESDDGVEKAFDIFARYTAGRFNRMRKHQCKRAGRCAEL